MIIARTCQHCQEPFSADSREVNRGNATYCSRLCSGRHRVQKLEPKLHNQKCSYALCGNTFYRNESQLRRSKSGHVFCNRLCKEAAQKLGGIREIMPNHYGTSTTVDYRTLAFLHYPHKCSHCGWDKYPNVLQVNHIDVDHENNEISNLEILCPTCHMTYHYLTKTGLWGSRTKV